MSRRHALLLVSSLAAALVASAATGTAVGAGRAAPPAGEIVFTSDRATANPGEVYALAPGHAPRNLSRSPAADVSLATSPKGRAYAFWSDRAGPWRLMVSSGGTALRSIAVAGAGSNYQPFAPVFSPDGTRLLITYETGNVTSPDVALAAVRSGPARRFDAPCLTPPTWSPDGLAIACLGPKSRQVSVSDLHGHVRFTVPGTTALWSPDGRLAITSSVMRTTVLSSTGSVVARLRGLAQGWSPDGRLLALTRTAPGELVLAEPGTAHPSRVVYHSGKYPPGSAVFTPDGRDVSFVRPDGTDALVPVGGGAPRRLPGGYGARWSSTGRYAFTIYRYPKGQGPTVTIEIADRLGRGARVVARLPFDDHGESDLAWLGDGSRLLYDGSVRDHSDLWAMATDGSAQRRLTSTGAAIAAPAWSGDGTKLAYSVSPFTGGLCGYCGGNVAIADVQGHRLALIPGANGSAGSDGTPAWAPNGGQLAITDDFNAGISLVGIDGNGRAQLVQPPAAAPAWSPDGATLAYVDNFGSGAIWGVDPTGANPRRLLPNSKLQASGVAWSPDGRELAFNTAGGIYVAPSDGSGTPQLVAPATRPGRPTFSPDGQWLAFAAQAGTSRTYTAIYEVGVDGSGLRQLTRGPFNSADPAWRPVPAASQS